MTRTAAFGLALAACTSALGAEYFVAPNGSDTNPGRSLAKPFRTIGRAAALMGPGDVCNIRAGVYRETVVPAKSGSAGAPMVFQPYKNEAVTISGADEVTGWRKDGDNWTATPTAEFRSVMNQADQVFVNGVQVNLARWPNTSLDPSRPAKATFTKFISKTRDAARNMTTVIFEDEAIPASANFTGAEIYVQPNHLAWSWTLSGRVVKHEGKRVTMETRNDAGKDGNGAVYDDRSRYYVYNRADLLDSNGEWFLDPASKRLSLRTPDGTSPAKHRVEAKRRDFGFNLTGKSYITLRNLRLFACSVTTDDQAGGDAIGYNADGTVRYPWRPAGFVAPSRGVVLDGLVAKYLNHFTDVSGHFFFQWGGNTGLVLSGEDHVIRNSRIQFSAGNGINLTGRRHLCENNVILDTGTAAVDCGAIYTGPQGPVEDMVIAYNTINRTGRSGIGLRSLTNSTPGKFVARVHHNDVANFMMQDWDGGAYYTFGADGRFARIDHNLFRIDDFKPEGMVFGAYWDFSKNFVLDHNVIVGVVTPIQLTHEFDPEKTKVNNMLIYNNTAITNDAMWSRPFASSTNVGSVVMNNILKVAVFPNPNGGKINHWPAYGSGVKDGKTMVKANLVYGDAPGGYYSKKDSLLSDDLWAEDAGFLNPSMRDFRLKSSSPAVGAGVAVPVVTRDGITVPSYSEGGYIGALEPGKPMWRVGAVLPVRK